MRKIEIEFNSIPDNVMIPVLRKRDIVKASILKASDKAKLPNGSADVRLVFPVGNSRLATRNEILTRYNYLNGRKIKLGGWKSSKEYTIMRNDNTPAVAMMLPSNYTVIIGGRKVVGRSRDYLVCLVGSDGKVDRTTVSIVNGVMFRKMFNILPNEVINKYKGKGSRGKKASERIPVESKLRDTKLPNLGITGDTMLDTGAEAIGNGLKGIDLKSNLNIDNKISNVSSNKAIDSVKSNKYSAVGRLINQDGKLVGFVVKNSAGMTKQISKRDMLVLCSSKSVDNMVLATREGSNTKYLRGNGIKIDSLEAVYV